MRTRLEPTDAPALAARAGLEPLDLDAADEPVLIRTYDAFPTGRVRVPSRVEFRLDRMQASALALAAVTVILWLRLVVNPPQGALPPADRAYATAGLRWAMSLTSERVDDFRRTYHRAPVDLHEVGFTTGDMIGYERLSDDRYRLSASSPSGPLVYDSMRPRHDFLGRSLEILIAASARAR